MIGDDGTTPSSTSAPSSAAAAGAPAKPKRPRRRELPRGLPPWRRLRATRDFTRVERQGIRASGALVAVTVRPGPGRLGLVVSKKVDNRSHERNLIKRRLREIFRAEKDRWARIVRSGAAPAPGQRPEGGGGFSSVDVVVLASPAAKGAEFEALREDALAALEKALQRLAATPKPASRPPPRPAGRRPPG